MIEDPYAKALYKVEVGDAFVESGQADLADRILSQALADAEMISQAYNESLALMEIAVRFARRKRAAEASDILFHALTLITAIEDSDYRARAPVKLAGKYREAGQKIGERERGILQEIIL